MFLCVGYLIMCLNPIRCVRLPSGKISFSPFAVGDPLQVACGECFECQQKVSNEWAARIVLEARQHKENCFVTLTFDEKNCPKEVRVRDIQLFMKKLRKEFPFCRFFASAEYGSLRGRPHYHIILFGVRFKDARFFKYTKRGEPIYRSSLLEKLWPYGFSSVGDITYQSAKYTAKYLQKFCSRFDQGQHPAFVCMSNRRGIAYDSIDPRCLKDDKLYLPDGRTCPVPRYFLKVLCERGFEEEVQELLHRRRVKAQLLEVSQKTLEERKQRIVQKFGLWTVNRKEEKELPFNYAKLALIREERGENYTQEFSEFVDDWQYSEKLNAPVVVGQINQQELIDSYRDCALEELLKRYSPEDLKDRGVQYADGVADQLDYMKDDLDLCREAHEMRQQYIEEFSLPDTATFQDIEAKLREKMTELEKQRVKGGEDVETQTQTSVTQSQSQELSQDSQPSTSA